MAHMSLTKKAIEIVNDPLPRDIVEKYVAWAKSEGIEYGLLEKINQLFQLVVT